MQTADEQDAHEALTKALQRVCQSHGWTEGATMTEYVVTGLLVEDKPRNDRAHTRYFTVLADDSMPEHHVVGLLNQSLHFYQQLSTNTDVS